MDNNLLRYLARGYLDGTLSKEELKEFREQFKSPEMQELLKAEMLNDLNSSSYPNVVPEDEIQAALERVMQQTRQKDPKPVPLRTIHPRTKWIPYAAATIIVCGVVAYLWNQQGRRAVKIESVSVQNDVMAPSVNRAMITLANGQKIYLDSAGNGKLAMEGNVRIQKMDNGQIIYHETGNVSEMQYNTLTVPRGSQITHLILADGSRVFVNAASSIKYPVAFIGNERKVEITGEAYFEVAKNPRKKFIVSSNGIVTEVLGTHFNVNTYADEGSAKITLLEGRVVVKREEETITIKPGEQVECPPQAKLLLHPHADVTQVMAWQRGMFLFTDMSLPAILRQLSRWYDVTVKYEGTLPATSYGGGLSRNLPLSEAIKLLESDKIKFILTGNLLTVQSK
jgi:transmembrane sensor